MQPKGFMPFYEDPKILAEIDIRGRFMRMACDIEHSLLGIMAFSTLDINHHHRAAQFDGMMMGQKIDCAICDIKKYHPKLYLEYKGSDGFIRRI